MGDYFAVECSPKSNVDFLYSYALFNRIRYDEYDHLGYDWDGKKILKPKMGDQLDEFLKKVEDPDFWRTVKDSQTGQDVVLSQEDIELIRRIQSQKVPDVNFDEYAVRL